MVRILPPLVAVVLVTALAFALAMTFALPRPAAADTESVSMACVDSNGNGVIDRAEAIDVLRQYLSGEPITAGQVSMACLDSNDNGVIDRAEAIAVLRQYLSGDPIPGRYDNLTNNPELPLFIQWEIQPSVIQWEAESVVQGVKVAYQFARKTGFHDPDENIVIYVDNDVDRLSEWYANQTRWEFESSREFWRRSTSTSTSRMGLIVIKTSTPDNKVWTQEKGLNGLPKRTMRRYVHAAMQLGVAGLLTDPGKFRQHVLVDTPRWLTYGMFGLLTDMAQLDYHNDSYPWPQTRERYVSQVAMITDVTLEDAEIWPEGLNSEDEAIKKRATAIRKCIYDCGYLAAELLASYVGVAGLSGYYMFLEPDMIPRGVDEEDFPRPGWRTAFEHAFGMTTEDFYRLFEEHKADGFPEVTIPEPE